MATRPRPLHEDFDVSSRNGANGNGRGDRLPIINGKPVDPQRISAELEEMSAEESIAWAIETFGPKLGFAVSFQKTSSVIIDIAHRIDPQARFFYLDTELLFAGDVRHARRARGALRDRVRAVRSGQPARASRAVGS